MTRYLRLLILLPLALTACNLSAASNPAEEEAQVQTAVAVYLETADASTGVEIIAPDDPTPIPTRVPVCTQPACAEGESLICPGDCPGGCGVICATPTPEPEEIRDVVSGDICFPGGVLPAMTAYFSETSTGQVTELPIAENQEAYGVDLPPGTYIAYAWTRDYSLGGLYSYAVQCGLQLDCGSHNPLEFTVEPGAAVENIDICDWYDPFKVPLPPGKEITDVTGGVSGNLSYPGKTLPAMRVVAFAVDKGFWYYINTPAGTGFYKIDRLPPGFYTVVVYNLENTEAGGYTEAVPCGLSGACTDHTLINVNVKAGETVTGIDPIDWTGAFPPNPMP